MSYESWRITFQSSEQAARCAYEALEQTQAKLDLATETINTLKGMLDSFDDDIEDLDEGDDIEYSGIEGIIGTDCPGNI